MLHYSGYPYTLESKFALSKLELIAQLKQAGKILGRCNGFASWDLGLSPVCLHFSQTSTPH